MLDVYANLFKHVSRSDHNKWSLKDMPSLDETPATANRFLPARELQP